MIEDPLVFLRKSVYGSEGPLPVFDSDSSFLEYLLRFTVKRAFRSSPFYRHLLESGKISQRSLSGFSFDKLHHLPLTTKEHLRQNNSRFLADDIAVVALRYTSGSTGDRTAIYISAEEIEAEMLFETLVGEGATRKPEVQLREFSLVNHAPFMPTHREFTIPIFFSPAWPVTIQNTIADLGRRHDIGGRKVYPTRLLLPPKSLRYLTYILQRKGIEPSSFHIREISNIGWYPSPTYRRFCKEIWLSDFYDNYSLSETKGSAVECSHHGPKHFTQFLIPEVLDSVTKRPLRNGGEGILTLTPLYPFQIATPLVRYWTGDFVRASEGKCKCGYQGLSIDRALGRAQDCFDFSGSVPENISPRIISVTDMIDEIEGSMPTLLVDPKLRVDSKMDLAPRFRATMTESSNRIRINLKLEAFPRTSIKMMKNAARKIEEGLARKYSRLGEILDKELAFEVTVMRAKAIRNPLFKP